MQVATMSNCNHEQPSVTSAGNLYGQYHTHLIQITYGLSGSLGHVEGTRAAAGAETYDAVPGAAVGGTREWSE